MKKSDLLSITELARLRKVTTETLRYYDRIGLVKPAYVDPDTKYRYYSIRQYERLGTVKELRQLGLSVDEVRDYFEDRNFEKSAAILARRHEKLQEEIRQKTLLCQALSRKLRFLEELSDLPVCNEVFACALPQRHILTFHEPAGGPKEHAFAFARLEACLDEVAPVLATDRVGVYSDGALLTPSETYIPCVPMLFLEDPGFPCPYLEVIPAGQYLCIYYHGSGLEEYNPAFQRVLDYMETHGLERDGRVLQIYKIDVTLTSDCNETLMELQVPVRKKRP